MTSKVKSTPDCSDVWEQILKVIDLNEQLGNKLADVFTDWECGWSEHVKEYHS